MNVIGLDPSLTSTGIALVDGHVDVIRTSELHGMVRLDAICRSMVRALGAGPVDLVAIEGYSMGSKGQAIFDLGELGGVLRHAIWSLGLPWVDIAPNSLKKYATGRGDADKTRMVVAARDRLDYGGYSPDEADALWLRAAGRQILGDPVIKLPALNVGALAGINIHPGRPTTFGGSI